jgi:hypothetical protein
MFKPLISGFGGFIASIVAPSKGNNIDAEQAGIDNSFDDEDRRGAVSPSPE